MMWEHDLKQLVLCGSDGWLDSLYGGQIKMYAQDLFVEALNDGDRWVATGFDENGEKFLIVMAEHFHFIWLSQLLQTLQKSGGVAVVVEPFLYEYGLFRLRYFANRLAGVVYLLQ